MPSLLDLVLFREIDASMISVTEDELASVKPGGPLPEGAVIIGEMTPALKCLLFLHRHHIDEYQKSGSKIKIDSSPLVGAVEFLTAAEEVLEILQSAAFFLNTFWTALGHEYGLDEDEVLRCSYDENFNIFLSP